MARRPKSNPGLRLQAILFMLSLLQYSLHLLSEERRIHHQHRPMVNISCPVFLSLRLAFVLCQLRCTSMSPAEAQVRVQNDTHTTKQGDDSAPTMFNIALEYNIRNMSVNSCNVLTNETNCDCKDTYVCGPKNKVTKLDCL